MALKQRDIKAAVARYVGFPEIEMNTDLIQDPRVADTWAIRTSHLTPSHMESKFTYFLLKGRDLPPTATLREIEYALEECEFTTWPPSHKKEEIL